MIETDDKVKKAVRMIQSISTQKNLTLCFSSGKDSVVLDYLAKEANCKIRRIHNVTTIDPPGTIPMALRYGCELKRSELSFLDLVKKKGFPTMFRRFCCEYLKEQYVAENILVGVRRDESVKRAKCYDDFSKVHYYSKNVYTVMWLPMVHFTDADIEYIVNSRSLECHPLYYDANGVFHVERRLGCIGCPLKSDRGRKDFQMYPKLLRQILKSGIIYHKKHGRTEYDAALNLVYNLFYSNHGSKRFDQTYKGLFQNDPWELLNRYFGIEKRDIMNSLTK